VKNINSVPLNIFFLLSKFNFSFSEESVHVYVVGEEYSFCELELIFLVFHG